MESIPKRYFSPLFSYFFNQDREFQTDIGDRKIILKSKTFKASFTHRCQFVIVRVMNAKFAAKATLENFFYYKHTLILMFLRRIENAVL